MFELYQFWFDIEKSREKKLYAIKLLLNDKNKFFNSKILYISIFFSRTYNRILRIIYYRWNYIFFEGRTK